MELQAYAKAGAVADEVLCSIRTVAAFGGETKEVQRQKSLIKMSIRCVLFSALTEMSFSSVKVRQELDLGAAMGHQEGSDYGLLHWIYVADYLPVLRSGLLVRLHPGGGHCRIHSRNTPAGITHPNVHAGRSLCFFFMYKLLQVFFGVLIAAMNLGQASPCLEAFAAGRGAATIIFETIDRVRTLHTRLYYM